MLARCSICTTISNLTSDFIRPWHHWWRAITKYQILIGGLTCFFNLSTHSRKGGTNRFHFHEWFFDDKWTIDAPFKEVHFWRFTSIWHIPSWYNKQNSYQFQQLGRQADRPTLSLVHGELLKISSIYQSTSGWAEWNSMVYCCCFFTNNLFSKSVIHTDLYMCIGVNKPMLQYTAHETDWSKPCDAYFLARKAQQWSCFMWACFFPRIQISKNS